MAKGSRGSRAAFLATLPALFACASGDEEPEPRVPVPQNVATISLERDGFRLRYPETWSVDTDAPGYDPDSFFLIEGPDGATIAFMMLDAPADPDELVGAILLDHGLTQAREREFDVWGSFEGVGRDVFGLDSAGVPAGMRAFAYSSTARSFLVAETYVEYGYAEARQGFDAVELSFSLLGDLEGWPDVSLGTLVDEGGETERWLVRPEFEMRFPAEWRIDADAPDYDPDSFFTILTPYESSWMVIQVLEGAFDDAALLTEARLGLESVLAEIDHEDSFEEWGELEGRGLELRGADRELPATMRIFVHTRSEDALLVTEFFYDELRPRLDDGFARAAESFRFR